MSHPLRAFGLRLQSDLLLPGAMRNSGETAQSSDIGVHFRHRNRGSIHLCCPEISAKSTGTLVGSRLGPYRLERDYLVYTQPGVASYRCHRDGRELEIEPFDDAPEEELAAYCEATALPALLWLNRTPILHAAAAVLPGCGDAVALAGISGVGKSSLLRTLLETGAGCVGDDAVALRICRESTAEISGLPATTYARTADGGRQRMPVRAEQQIEHARLGLVVELAEDGPARPQQQRGAAALAVLLRNVHRVRVARLLQLEASLLAELAWVACTTPVWQWSAREALKLAPEELGYKLQKLAGDSKSAREPFSSAVSRS